MAQDIPLTGNLYWRIYRWLPGVPFCLIILLNSVELVYQGLILVWIACSETILQNKAPLFKQYKVHRFHFIFSVYKSIAISVYIVIDSYVDIDRFLVWNIKFTMEDLTSFFISQVPSTNSIPSFREHFEQTPLGVAIWTYLGYAILVVIGQIRDFLRSIGIEKIKSCTEPKLPVRFLWVHWLYANLHVYFSS